MSPLQISIVWRPANVDLCIGEGYVSINICKSEMKISGCAIPVLCSLRWWCLISISSIRALVSLAKISCQTLFVSWLWLVFTCPASNLDAKRVWTIMSLRFKINCWNLKMTCTIINIIFFQKPLICFSNFWPNFLMKSFQGCKLISVKIKWFWMELQYLLSMPWPLANKIKRLMSSVIWAFSHHCKPSWVVVVVVMVVMTWQPTKESDFKFF